MGRRGDALVSIFEDFARTGELTDELVELLYRTVRVVGSTRLFPAPDGRSWSDDDAVWETAHDFLYTAEGKSRMVALLVSATDQRSFERLLDRSVRNFLRDHARKTDVGKLVRRVNEVAATDETLEVAGTEPRRWCLKGGPSEPSAATAGALAASINGVAVVVPPWSSETRDAPVADRASILAMIHAMLKISDGSLSAPDIAHAVTTRLDTRRTMPTMSLDEAMDLGFEPADVDLSPDAAVLARTAAVAVLYDLDDEERILVANPDATVRKLSELLGVSKSQAAKLRIRVESRLAHAVSARDDAEAILKALDGLCSDWYLLWTGSAVPTSDGLSDTETGMEG